jgi:hypothetical protein
MPYFCGLSDIDCLPWTPVWDFTSGQTPDLWPEFADSVIGSTIVVRYVSDPSVQPRFHLISVEWSQEINRQARGIGRSHPTLIALSIKAKRRAGF